MSLYPSGIDCVWIAIDEAGFVGAMVTGGVAPIPKVLLKGEEMAVVDVEEAICALKIGSKVELLKELPRPDDYCDLGERGFFVFDWSDVHRTSDESLGAYELIAKPTSPIERGSIGPMLGKWLIDEVVLTGVTFSEQRLVDVRTLLDCVEPL